MKRMESVHTAAMSRGGAEGRIDMTEIISVKHPYGHIWSRVRNKDSTHNKLKCLLVRWCIEYPVNETQKCVILLLVKFSTSVN